MTTTPPDADLDEQERRLRADFEDARIAYQRAKGNLDRIANELRDLRLTRAACENARRP
jgi:hypothetical protein